MASVVDYGKVAGDKLNAPKLGGTDGWAAAIAAALNNSDTTVDVRISTAVGGRVAKTGDTMTGDLKITSSGPWLILNSPTTAQRQLQIKTNDMSRWTFGTGTDTESGSNTGSNFTIARYSDAGAWIDNPLSITRADGVVAFTKPIWLGDPVPTQSQHAASKQYADTKAPLSHSHLIADLPTGTTGTTVALGNHLHAGVYASVSHSHLIADLPTGTTGTTVALGNHTHSTYALTSHSHVIGDLPTGTTGTTVALGNHTHSYEASGAVATHDALATAHSALRATVNPKDLNASTIALGTSTKFAREDHKHLITSGMPGPLGPANDMGYSDALALADHVHIYPTAANVGALPLAGGTISGALTVNGQLTASTDLAVTGDAYLYGDLMMNSANTAKRRIYWPGDTVFAVGASGNVSISDTAFQVYRPMRVGALTVDSLAVIDPADPYSGQGFISWVGGVLDLSSTSWVGGTPYVRYNQVPTQSGELVNKQYADTKVSKTGGTMTGELVVTDGDNTTTYGAGGFWAENNVGTLMITADGGLMFRSDDIWFMDSSTGLGAVLHNVATPVDSGDAANKAYVDSKQEVTVSNVAPSGAPARDGLMWVVVP